MKYELSLSDSYFTNDKNNFQTNFNFQQRLVLRITNNVSDNFSKFIIIINTGEQPLFDIYQHQRRATGRYLSKIQIQDLRKTRTSL